MKPADGQLNINYNNNNHNHFTAAACKISSLKGGRTCL